MSHFKFYNVVHIGFVVCIVSRVAADDDDDDDDEEEEEASLCVCVCVCV